MTAEGAKVRVVRCPRCKKLLPELPNFNVYQCGSCGATLQAKKQGLETSQQSSPTYSDNVKTSIMDSPDISLEKKRIVTLSKSSETAGEGGTVEAAKQEPLLRAGGSSFRSEADGNIPGEVSSSKLEKIQVENVEKIQNRHVWPSKQLVPGLKPNPDKSGENTEEGEETKVHAHTACSSNATRQTQTMKHVGERGFALRRALRARGETLKVSYRDGGPSSYCTKVSGTSEEKHKGFFNGIDDLEQDRAELLRKLDDLRDKLKRSGEVTDLLRDRRTSEAPYRVPQHPIFRERFSSSLTRASDHHPSFADGHNAEVPSFGIHDVHGYGDHLVPQMLGNAHFQHHLQYPRRPPDNCLYGQFDPDPFISYHHDGLPAQTACTRVHCSTGHWRRPKHSQAIFSNSRASYFPAQPSYQPRKNASLSGSRGYNQNLADARLFCGDFSRGQQKFKQSAKSVETKGQSCQPIAGGAPFVVCYNCVELLRLPQNLFLTVNSTYRLQCGSCSEIIPFELDGKRLVISAPDQPPNSITGTHNISNRILDSSGSQNHSNGYQVLSYSGEYDIRAYDIPSTDEKLVLSSPVSVSSDEVGLEYEVDMSRPHKVRGVPSTSRLSGNVVIQDSMSCQQGIPTFAELPCQNDDTSDVPSVPFHEHLGPSLTNQIIDGPGKESRSGRSDQDRILSVNGNFRQNSIKDVLVVTEMDVPPDEFPNFVFSQDSCDASKVDDHPRNNKGSRSFLAGLMKRSFRDFLRFNSENGRSKVSINGHPISDRLVLRAEKYAGPIHPGDYWYDYRAGFWGVMGNACLGIIPPFIEEFNYPMPKTCSGGNTGVFVNGRELHGKDLGLLAGRGLPTTSGRSYVIEISGEVWDEDSGEELDSLGKLAPTVEKVKHGFGMRAPRIFV